MNCYRTTSLDGKRQCPNCGYLIGADEPRVYDPRHLAFRHLTPTEHRDREHRRALLAGLA